MSTRSNIVLKDKYGELWFYRHSDGHPGGAMPLIAEFVKWVNDGTIRTNISQAGGWLIALGMCEYGVILKPGDKPTNWKVGAIEPTKAQHGDIEYLYTIMLEENGEFGLSGHATVTCDAVGRSGEDGRTDYRDVNIGRFLVDGELCTHPNPKRDEEGEYNYCGDCEGILDEIEQDL